MKDIFIIHIDTGDSWRGGQQQAFYLHQSLCINGVKSLMICRKRSAMKRVCEEKGLPYYCLPLASEFDLYSGYMIARMVSELEIRNEKLEIKTPMGNSKLILQLHTAHAVSIGLIAKWFRRKIKLVAVRRVDYPLSKVKYNHKFLDVLVCVTKDIYEIALKYGVYKDKLLVINSGIDTEKYRVCDDNDLKAERAELMSLYDIPKDHLIIGTAGAFSKQKDYPTLLKTARIILDKYRNITFVAIGDGEQRDTIVSLHKSLDLGKSFVLAGFQADNRKYIHFFDIFVLTSKNEGFVNSVLDAMSAGKAVVATKVGGVPEMIKHEINGLLAEKENPEDIAEKLAILIDDAGLRDKLSKQAIVDVQEFDIKNTVKKYVELYGGL